MKYRKKYEKEAQMHLPDIPALDPCKVAQRPNMRRLNLIGVDELDDTRKHVLGSGAFGIVYAVRTEIYGKIQRLHYYIFKNFAGKMEATDTQRDFYSSGD